MKRHPGKDAKTDRKGQQDRTLRTGKPRKGSRTGNSGRESQERTARMVLLGKVCQIVLPGKDEYNKTTRTGHPGWDENFCHFLKSS